MKKMHLRQLHFRNLMRIQELKKIKNNSIELHRMNLKIFNNDSGKRPQIWQYPQNQIDEVQKTYLKCGSYQIHLETYFLHG